MTNSGNSTLYNTYFKGPFPVGIYFAFLGNGSNYLVEILYLDTILLFMFPYVVKYLVVFHEKKKRYLHFDILNRVGRLGFTKPGGQLRSY